MARRPRLVDIKDTEADDTAGSPMSGGDEQETEEVLPGRDEELSGKDDVKKQLLDIFKDVERGFNEQHDRSNLLMDYWDLYNCVLGPKQFYSGNSKIFVPIVANAVNARKTRFANQLFPQSGRNIEVVSENGDTPNGLVALLENYISRNKLRTQVLPALLKNGDIEGQYTLYISWSKRTRHVARRVMRPVIAEDDGSALPGSPEIDDIEEQEIVSARPSVEVIADSDFLVLPLTADSQEDAIEDGGSVTILRRWSAARIKRAIKDEEISKEAGERLVETMNGQTSSETVDKPKRMVDAAGIYFDDDGGKHALVYETWTRVEIDDELLLCRAYYGGEDNVLGCKRNPYWSDRLPTVSVPVEKVQGSFKGISKLKPVADLQYCANDACNEAMDSAAYALMPIIMTDPEKNPRVGSMVLSLAAIWETSPNDTQFAKFPDLWKDGFTIVQNAKAQIFEALSVNPAMVTRQSIGTNKLSQAEVANEQQIDIISTADAVSVLEEGILSPMLERFMELDHQFRDKNTTVRQYGEMGMRANMEVIEPIQFDHRYDFRWFGVDAARSAQQVQQQIAAMNILRGIPPDQYPGYKLNVVPVLSQLIENAFGPRLGPLIFQSVADQMPVDPATENSLLTEGFDVQTHPLDDDDQHIAMHMAAAQMAPDHRKQFEIHIFKHVQQKQAKMAAAQAQAMQQMQAAGGVQMQQPGEPGIPGGAGPGVAGTPRIGAQPRGPRTQGPPGMIHKDQMKDPAAMPRKVG